MSKSWTDRFESLELTFERSNVEQGTKLHFKSRKEGTFCASGLAGIEPTPPAPEERGMRAFRQLG
jgi:hypothetical protein